MLRLSFNNLANSESDCEEPEEGGSGHLTEHGGDQPTFGDHLRPFPGTECFIIRSLLTLLINVVRFPVDPSVAETGVFCHLRGILVSIKCHISLSPQLGNCRLDDLKVDPRSILSSESLMVPGPRFVSHPRRIMPTPRNSVP